MAVGNSDLKVLSLNVRGLNNKSKRLRIYNWINSYNYDVCFLQETFCTKSFEAEFKKGWNGTILHSFSNSTHSRGVSILISSNVDCKVVSSHTDNVGRMALLNIEIGSIEYSLLNVYAPNDSSDRISFLKQIRLFLNQHAVTKTRLIIAGDFNCVLERKDRASGNIDNSSNFLRQLLDDLKLIDIWRSLHPNEVEYTYIHPSVCQRNSRIDYILCSESLMTYCTLSNICQAPSPDHKGIYVCIKTVENERGRGYWKLNNNFLKYKSYEEGITNIYNDVITEYGEHADKVLLWDYFKMRVKQYSIYFGVKLARENRDNCKSLESELDEIDKKLASSEIPTNQLQQQRLIVKKKLDEQYDNKAKGYQIRSRAKWVEEGERSTKYFLGLEKMRQNYNCITSLKDGNQNVYKDKDILRVATNFYSELYSAKSIDANRVNSFFESITPERVLSDDIQQNCEGLFTNNECLCAINNMKRNKSPGLDGLSIEFYDKFWPLIGDFMVDVFNESYKNGMLPDSQRQAVFTLIFKKGKQDEIANYRPISLTNLDYRVMAFVLAQRLQSVIDTIVSNDQTAYIKNRYMGYNIRLVEDVIAHFNQLEKNGILFMVDFRKAFDSLDWNFMFQTLEFFNFGPSFKRWIQIIYTLPAGVIKNNGHLSDQFSIHRGIRQGCPVSALLFVLCVEILGLQIRQHRELKGYSFGYIEKPVKIMQYADDCILFINDKTELCTVINLLNDYGNISGLELNIIKCEGLWLGRDKHKQANCNIFGIKWPDQIRCLGIYVGNKEENNIEKNWMTKIEKMEEILQSWKKRDLSLFGKVQIIKTFIISQFVLPATLLVVPVNVMQRIESAVYKFLWGNRDKIKRLKVIQELKDGGLNMVDVKSIFMSFKTTWIQKICNCDPNFHNWAQLALYNLKQCKECNTELIFNFDETVCISNLPCSSPFYKEVLVSYNKLFVSDISSFKNSIFNQCIWGNKFITVRKQNKKEVLFLRNWIRSGVNQICDLKFVNGKLDVDYMYGKINHKQNVLSEIFTIRQALLPYSNYLINVTDVLHINEQFDYDITQLRKSKEFYVKYRNMKTKNVPYVTAYLNCFVNENDDASDIFTRKVVLEKEIKLKEFNFKMLHGILPCNVNLKRWKIKCNDLCDVCGQPQTIEHLLFNCTYVRPLWDKVESSYCASVNYRNILGIEPSLIQDNIFTLISFLVYKEWLVLSLANKSRCKNIKLDWYKQEISTRLSIYKYCKLYDENELTYLSCSLAA